METTDNSVLSKYQAELIEDIQINELNVREKIMQVPIIKHKWIGRLMVHKSQLQKLEVAKKKALKEYTDNSPIVLSKKVIEDANLNDANIINIEVKITEIRHIVEYLEKVEKILGSLTWDCKNFIDMQKLETT